MMEQSRTHQAHTTTFLGNMSLPIHRWFRYAAGFSASWAESIIRHAIDKNKGSHFKVLDPFAGVGTVLLECDKLGVSSYGFEAHPFVSEIASVKLLWHVNSCSFRRYADMILCQAQSEVGAIDDYPDIVQRCYDEDNLRKVDVLHKAIKAHDDGSSEHKLAWLAFISILRTASQAGTAIWQYVLPNKQKAKVSDVFEAYMAQVELMVADIIIAQSSWLDHRAVLLYHDSRNKLSELNNMIDLIITSPPYANNYDYADATRLELSVLGRVKSWGELQTKIRPGLIRSCSQMVAKERKYTFDILKAPNLTPIYNDIYDVCLQLEKERSSHGGKKNYHTMIALYFFDLARVWKNLRCLCRPGAQVCFVIGDSAPYGIYVPVDEWLGKLAVAAGFKGFSFEKIRDRNVKWKNRKHSVPLKEGLLWVEG